MNIILTKAKYLFAHHFFSLVVISLLVSQPRKRIARLTLPKSTGACLRLET